MDKILPLLLSYFWIWIPIVAILAGSFKEWLKFKEKTASLGASTDELERIVHILREERETMVRRIENLEAIVTHEVWDARAQLPSAEPRIDPGLLSPSEPSDRERAAVLARRLKS